MKPGPLIMLLIGTILALIGLGLTITGTVAAVAAGVQGENGYFSTRTVPLVTNSYALTSPPVGPVTTTGTTPPLNLDVARIRLVATGANDDPVFLGIAPQADVDDYLANVAHTEVRGIESTPFRARYGDIAGTERPEPPADQDFWTVSASGPGSQEITWPVQPGSWAVVVMNADGSSPVAVQVSAGVRSGLLAPAAITLLLIGILTLVVGLVLVILGVIGLGRNGPAPSSRGDVAATPGGPAGQRSRLCELQGRHHRGSRNDRRAGRREDRSRRRGSRRRQGSAGADGNRCRYGAPHRCRGRAHGRRHDPARHRHDNRDWRRHRRQHPRAGGIPVRPRLDVGPERHVRPRLNGRKRLDGQSRLADGTQPLTD